MNVLIYATTFGADLLSLAYYLQNKKGIKLKVSLPNVDVFKNEPINKLFPLDVELLERDWTQNLGKIKDFKPDITIMDNNIPIRKTSPKALILWHGYGWKGPNDVEEFKWLHRNIRLSWGDMMVPNPDITWQCFGPLDFEHRTKTSGFHEENCKILGAASHDQLINPIEKELLQPFYPFDVVNKKTVLLAPTWHYGEVFSHWGNDETIFRELIKYLESKDTNLILRLHDSDRFDTKYVDFLNRLKSDYPNIVLKFKNQNPDNFLDLQVADVMLTNFSSIANLYYATKRPTIHIYPVASEDEAFLHRRKTIFGQMTKQIESVKFIWKFSPEENGGLLARSFAQMMEQLETALNNPDCCVSSSQKYLDKHMLGADGKNRGRVWTEMQRLLS
ncbi:hypothetical protein EP331_06390 [bacterium]|nr:MAG: hypothetical protein EP331_06390 [bacterium]